ncbi:PH domain-containing protein [Kaistella jeonii]|uniref:PH domain-containing protein n=1 Tax=Kaistella jeonii TaxID=266749 RepID=UPI00146FC93B|nr:PH domain-containing protein [Kaistella jeonii]
MTFLSYLKQKDPFIFIPIGLLIGILLFFAVVGNFILKIIIDDQQLIIRFFFNIYKTDIKHITKIRKGETMWSGFHKYGTGTKGLIIFSKYKNELYITPENEELFYQKILEINPNVVIDKV